MKSITRVLYSLLTLGSLLGGLVCLGFGLLPYPLLKRVGDGLSKDGDLVSFTPGLHANLQLKMSLPDSVRILAHPAFL